MCCTIMDVLLLTHPISTKICHVAIDSYVEILSDGMIVTM
jgi:hypothetical protein